jgi:hypothetical protein
MTKVEMAALVWTFEMVDEEIVTEGTSLTLYTHLSRNSSNTPFQHAGAT